MSATAQAIRIPHELREFWQKTIARNCLVDAGLLNLIPYPDDGVTDLGKLPPDIHEFAFSLCSDLLERVCRAELKLGSRSPVLRQRVASEIWRALKPFARKGRFYIDHLVSRGTNTTSR